MDLSNFASAEPGRIHRVSRRQLVTIAVRDYPDQGDGFARGIDEQLEVARSWWCDPELGERVFASDGLGNLQTRRDIEVNIDRADLRNYDKSDILVLYITGHGVVGGSGSHYLLLPDSDEERLVATAYPTAGLITAALDSRAEHVLIIVNSCYTGALQDELARLRKDIIVARQSLATIGVFITADYYERPRVHEFADLLRCVVERLRTTTQIDSQHLSFEQFLAELTRAARDRSLLEPMKLWPLRYADEPSFCLPNPGYQSSKDLVEPSRRQVAVTESELEYWLGRASGRTSPADPGWYFTGRSDLMNDVVEFIKHGEGVLAITGAAGTGKSAIIARAVTLSDPAFLSKPRYADVVTAIPPKHRPPPGSIDAAVLARNKDVDEIAAALLVALGENTIGETRSLPPVSMLLEQLAARLTQSGRSHTLVVDGVDEARAPGRLLLELVGPLARLGAHMSSKPVRLVLGMRSSISGPPIGSSSIRQVSEAGLPAVLLRVVDPAAVTWVRTDGPGVTDDIAAYVSALLGQGMGPYTNDSEQRQVLARTVAEMVTPSFLDAKLAGDWLREQRYRQDPADPDWLASLDEGTVGLLCRDLNDIATYDRPAAHLLAILRAAAFAPGAGIPWADVWPAVAEAILSQPLLEADQLIRYVLNSRLAGYFARDSEDGYIVHRLSHEKIAEVLRQSPQRLLARP